MRLFCVEFVVVGNSLVYQPRSYPNNNDLCSHSRSLRCNVAVDGNDGGGNNSGSGDAHLQCCGDGNVRRVCSQMKTKQGQGFSGNSNLVNSRSPIKLNQG